MMKLDQKMLKVYAKLPDAVLWGQIVALASEHGVTLPREVPPKEDMMRLRRLMTGDVQLSLSEAFELVESYKRRASGGSR